MYNWSILAEKHRRPAHDVITAKHKVNRSWNETFSPYQTRQPWREISTVLAPPQGSQTKKPLPGGTHRSKQQQQQQMTTGRIMGPSHPHARTHARTHARIHSFIRLIIHSLMHLSTHTHTHTHTRARAFIHSFT